MPSSHNAIVKWLQTKERGKLLDVPCGSGVISRELGQMGFSVFCCDIDPGNFGLEGSFDFRTADLNRDELPYNDNEFHYIVCSNGIHRLFNIATSVSEFGRILEPGGSVILSFPNYVSAARRIKFLLSGSIGNSIDNPGFHQRLTEAEANFRFPLTPQKVVNSINQSVLTLVGVFISGMVTIDYLCLPVSATIKVLSMIFSSTRSSVGNCFTLLMGGDTIHFLLQKR